MPSDDMASLRHARARELRRWQADMQAAPGFVSLATTRSATQAEQLHPREGPSRRHRDHRADDARYARGLGTAQRHRRSWPARCRNASARVAERVEFFRRTAAPKSGITGAGGIFLGLADFPLLLTLKLKLLFEISALYGHSGEDYTERLYMLYVFQLAFSSASHRRDVYAKMPAWRGYGGSLHRSTSSIGARFNSNTATTSISRSSRMLPVVGAPVGVVVNYRLLRKPRRYRDQRVSHAMVR